MLDSVPASIQQVNQHKLLTMDDGSQVDAYVPEMYVMFNEAKNQKDTRVKAVSWWKDIRRVEERLIWESDVEMQVSEKHATRLYRQADFMQARERIASILSEQNKNRLREWLVGHGNLSAMVVEYIVTGDISEIDKTLRLHHEKARLVIAGTGVALSTAGVLAGAGTTVLKSLAGSGFSFASKGLFVLLMSQLPVVLIGEGVAIVAGVALVWLAKNYTQVIARVRTGMTALWDYIFEACRTMEKLYIED